MRAMVGSGAAKSVAFACFVTALACGAFAADTRNGAVAPGDRLAEFECNRDSQVFTVDKPVTLYSPAATGIQCTWTVRLSPSAPSAAYPSLKLRRYHVTSAASKLEISNDDFPNTPVVLGAQDLSDFPIVIDKPNKAYRIIWSGAESAPLVDAWELDVSFPEAARGCPLLPGAGSCGSAHASRRGICRPTGCYCYLPWLGDACGIPPSFILALSSSYMGTMSQALGPGVFESSSLSSIMRAYRDGATAVFDPSSPTSIPDSASQNLGSYASLRDAAAAALMAAVAWEELALAASSAVARLPKPQFVIRVVPPADGSAILASKAAACMLFLDSMKLSSKQILPTLVFDGQGASFDLEHLCYFVRVTRVNVVLRKMTVLNALNLFESGSVVRSFVGNLDLEEVDVQNSIAYTGGAAFLTQASVLTWKRSSITNSRAILMGGAIYASDGADIIGEHLVFAASALVGLEGNGTVISTNTANKVKLTYTSIAGCTIPPMSGAGAAIFMNDSAYGVELAYFSVTDCHTRFAPITLVQPTTKNMHTTTIIHSVFKNNTALPVPGSDESTRLPYSAGAVYVHQLGRKFSMVNLTVVGNRGHSHGGIAIVDRDRALRFRHDVDFEILESEFRDNGALSRKGDGGALYIMSTGGQRVYGQISDTVFIRNKAGGSGGGIFLRATDSENGAQLTSLLFMDRASMHDNSAGSSGGALYAGVSDMRYVAENVEMSNNVAASGDGGAVTILGTSLRTVWDNFMVQNNSAGGGGGGMYMTSACNPSCRIRHLSLLDNHAQTGPGGGMYIGGGFLELEAFRSLNNRAGQDGGGLCAEKMRGVLITRNSRFVKNEAGRSGGALRVGMGGDATRPFDMRDVSFEQSAARLHGSVVHFSAQTEVSVNIERVTTNHADTRDLSGTGAFSFSIVVGVGMSGNIAITDLTSLQTTAGVGAFLYASNAVLSLYNVQVRHSRASAFGGAIALAGFSHLRAERLKLFDCHAGHAGGAIFLASGSNVTLSGSRIDSCTARLSGGGVHVGSEPFMDVAPRPTSPLSVQAAFNYLFVANPPVSAVVLDNSTVLVGNRASRGGAMRLQKIAGLHLRRALFEHNSAVDDDPTLQGGNGGALWYSCRDDCRTVADLNSPTVRFVGNVAQKSGGALFWAPNAQASHPAFSDTVHLHNNSVQITPAMRRSSVFPIPDEQAGAPYRVVCAVGGALSCRGAQRAYPGISLWESVQLNIVDYWGHVITGVEGLIVSAALPETDSAVLAGRALNSTRNGEISFADLELLTQAGSEELRLEVAVQTSPLAGFAAHTDAENFDLASHNHTIVFDLFLGSESAHNASTDTAPFDELGFEDSAMPCPRGLVLHPAAVPGWRGKALHRCIVCPGPSFFAINVDQKQCYDCPDGAHCMGGSNVEIRDGYWRAEDSILFFKCKRNTCNGGFSHTIGSKNDSSADPRTLMFAVALEEAESNAAIALEAIHLHTRERSNVLRQVARTDAQVHAAEQSRQLHLRDLAALRLEMSSTKAAIREQSTGREELVRQLLDLESAIQSLESAIEGLATEWHEATAARQEAKRDLRKVDTNLEKARRRFALNQNHIADYRAEIELRTGGVVGSGKTLGRCAEGSDGPLCDACLDGYFPVSRGCKSCSSILASGMSVFVTYLIILHLVFAFIVIALHLSTGKVVSGALRIVINHIQMCALIFSGTGRWPEPLYSFLDATTYGISIPTETHAYRCSGLHRMSIVDHVRWSALILVYVPIITIVPPVLIRLRQKLCSKGGLELPSASTSQTETKATLRQSDEQQERNAEKSDESEDEASGDEGAPLGEPSTALRQSAGTTEAISVEDTLQSLKDLKAKKFRWSTVVQGFVFLWIVLYPMVARYSFLLFGCFKYSSTLDDEVLIADPRIPCSAQSEASTVAVVNIFVVVIGLPAAILIIQTYLVPSRRQMVVKVVTCGLRKPKKEADPSQDQMKKPGVLKGVVTLLELDFAPSYWFWELVLIARRAGLAYVVTSLKPTTQRVSQYDTLMLLVVFLALYAQLWARPFVYYVCNVLEAVSLTTCLVTAWTAMLATSGEALAEELGLIIFGANVAAALSILGIAGYELHESGAIPVVFGHIGTLFARIRVSQNEMKEKSKMRRKKEPRPPDDSDDEETASGPEATKLLR